MVKENCKLIYLSTGVADTAFSSQVLSVIEKLVLNGLDVYHVSLEPFKISNVGGGIKRRELVSQKVKSFYLWQLPLINKITLWIDVYRLAKLLRKLIEQADCEKVVIHARSQINAWKAIQARKITGLKFKIFADFRGVIVDEQNYHSRAGGFIVSYFLKQRIELFKKIEKEVLGNSDYISCVSRSFKEHLEEISGRKDIDCNYCVVDYDKFGYSEEKRNLMRKELNISDKKVILYSGGVSRWQRFDIIVGFVKKMREFITDLYFLVLTPTPDEAQKIVGLSIEKQNYSILNVPHEKVPDYLNAADMGILFRDKTLTNRVASPIKFSEYTACGLPCITNRGIGDIDYLLDEMKAGVFTDNLEPEEISVNTLKILGLDRKEISMKSKNYFDLERYVQKLIRIYCEM